MIGGWRRWRRPAIDIGLIASLLFALSFVPPDSSSSERAKQGILRFCVGNAQDPLVLPPQGYEYRLVKNIAETLRLQLEVVEVANIGRSYNPRDWDISRGQCDMLGGGLADSNTNRGFMTLLPNGGEIGLVRSGAETLPPKGSEIGVYMGSAGLDRLRLSRWLREEGLKAKPLANLGALTAWMAKGKPAIFSSMTPLATQVPTYILPEAAAVHEALAFGLWRGDVTLTRDIRAALQQARASIHP